LPKKDTTKTWASRGDIGSIEREIGLTFSYK
jgi:hypothetical protein